MNFPVPLRGAGQIALALFTLIFLSPARAQSGATPADLTPAEARAIAKEAYIYAYPMVDAYRILWAFCVDKNSPEFKAPWNTINNQARVFTPADTTVQTPNSDTPYSMLGMDLRAEPLVLTVPKIEKGRYYSIQLVDLYTFNYAYIGSRATGNEGGHFMIAGPSWQGETPPGITKAIRCETNLGLAIYRTQLFDPADIDKVKAIQAGYLVQPLSDFLGKKSPAIAGPIKFLTPLSAEAEKTSPQVFNVLNFLLQFCPTDPSETALRQRFARIGVVPGKTFDITKLPPKIQTAVTQGIADAWTEYAALKIQVDQGKVTSGQLFGTRAFLKGNYLYRMAAAILGIFGNSRAEAMYPLYNTDSTGLKLDGSNNYTVTFPKGQLPPVDAFWSLTMYKMPSSLLVANPIQRYLINSPMLPNLKLNADGSLTIYIQQEAPSGEKAANWLPSPAGPFSMAMRLYWPGPAALDGSWTHPPAVLVK